MVRVILSVCFVFEDLELAEWTLPPRCFQVIQARKNLKTTKSLLGHISSTVRPRMLQVKDPFDLLNLLFIKGLFTPNSKRKSSGLLRGLRKEDLSRFLNLTSSRGKIKIFGRSTIWWRKVQYVLASQRPCKFWGRAETKTQAFWSYHAFVRRWQTKFGTELKTFTWGGTVWQAKATTLRIWLFGTTLRALTTKNAPVSFVSIHVPALGNLRIGIRSA